MSESIRDIIWSIGMEVWRIIIIFYHQPPLRSPRQSSSWRRRPTARHWPGPSLGPNWGSPGCSDGATSAGSASPLWRPAWTRTSSSGCFWEASPLWGSLARVWQPLSSSGIWHHWEELLILSYHFFICHLKSSNNQNIKNCWFIKKIFVNSTSKTYKLVITDII